MKENNCKAISMYPGKQYTEIEGEIKTFLDKN
jgi:hypothetical protein